MNLQPSFIDLRSHLAYEFSTLRMRALRESFLAKLIGKHKRLAIFPQEAPKKSPNRKLIGVKDIPLGGIIGTLGRQSDFDQQFRPLKKNLRDRWVNVYLIYKSEGWLPILVHKVEENYYVEDGHHRVSVARALGMAFIQAKVWEYPIRNQQTKKCEAMESTERRSAKQHVMVTD